LRAVATLQSKRDGNVRIAVLVVCTGRGKEEKKREEREMQTKKDDVDEFGVCVLNLTQRQADNTIQDKSSQDSLCGRQEGNCWS
jgi:hypothetical protein